MKLYVSGVEHFSAAHSGTFAPDTTPVIVGGNINTTTANATECVNGMVDDLRIYNRALSASEVSTLYTGAAPPGGDTTPPQVAIASPSPGITVSGSLNHGDGLGRHGRRGVTFRIDGAAAGTEDTTSPYSLTVDTAQYSNGQHTLTAVARDTAGNLAGSAGVTITFSNTTPTVRKVMPLGDSITYGFISPNTAGNDDGGYRRYLWVRLAAGYPGAFDFIGSLTTGVASIDRNHEGHPAWRIEDIGASLNNWLATYRPDLILLMLGTNNLIQTDTPQTALNRLGSLLDQIHAALPAAQVLVSSIPPVRANNDYPSITPQEISTFNAGIPSLVSARAGQGWKIAFVDIAGVAGLNTASGSTDYGSDGLHPSLAGYSMIANVWYTPLTQ